MKNIIKNLETLGVVTILKLNGADCSATFYFNGQEIAQTEMGNSHGTHNEESLLKGLKTNYEWKGLFYKIPARVKQIKEIEQNQVA